MVSSEIEAGLDLTGMCGKDLLEPALILEEGFIHDRGFSLRSRWQANLLDNLSDRKQLLRITFDALFLNLR